jgi:hypothetical protein
VPAAVRRSGYVVAVLVNAVLLWVVNNLEEWDVVPWLTDDFSRVVPIINVSLVASLVANLMYLGYDTGWFKSLTQIVLLSISMAVMIRMYSVFPFDFSAYDFNWETVARVVMILAMVGIGIGIIVEVSKSLGRMLRS